jgi:hypothetical protein
MRPVHAASAAKLRTSSGLFRQDADAKDLEQRDRTDEQERTEKKIIPNVNTTQGGNLGRERKDEDT